MGNLSRNVVFESENPDGVRGLVMLHNAMDGGSGVSNTVLNAEFKDLGRTDFTRSHDDDNPIGRYSLHLHLIGTDEDDPYAILSGNAINGGKGWGIVQHESNANVVNNVVYDLISGGIVSETGNENGYWADNLVSTIRGHDNADRNEDGVAYENQSRVIVQTNNVAANSKTGWNFSAKDPIENARVEGIHHKLFERDQMRHDPSPFDVALSNKEPALDGFDGNTVIASGTGMRIFHRNESDDTDLMSVVTD